MRECACTSRIRCYSVHTFDTQNPNEAVACPWILGSRLSIILSAPAASLGECEAVRMLWWQLGLTQTSCTLLSRIAMCRLKACPTRRGARAGGDRHFCLSLPCNLFDREAAHSYGQGGHSGEDRMPRPLISHTPHAQTMSSSGYRRLCSALRTRGPIIS